MKSITFFFLIVSILGCSKAAQELTLSRMDYNGNEIRIDGYYYHQLENDFHCFILYSNGVYYRRHFLSNSLVEADNSINKSDINEQNRDLQYNWGVFQVEGEIIKIERWLPGNGGPYPVQLLKGEILNNETILISGLRGTKYEDEIDTFRFRPLSPKPDSTNVFIE